MATKYPVYFGGGSFPYYKLLTLAQAKREAEVHMPRELQAAGFQAFVHIMDVEVTGKHRISIRYGKKTEQKQ